MDRKPPTPLRDSITQILQADREASAAELARELGRSHRAILVALRAMRDNQQVRIVRWVRPARGGFNEPRYGLGSLPDAKPLPRVVRTDAERAAAWKARNPHLRRATQARYRARRGIAVKTASPWAGLGSRA